MLPKVGDTSSLTRTITQDDVQSFGTLVGDLNPIHVDDEFGKKTRFGRCIAHGMWGASLISTILGTRLPGPGTIYLSQTLSFQAPIYPGDTVTARVTVLKVREDKRIVTLDTVCEDQAGKLLLKGEAVVLYEPVE
jgi:phosphate acetyltransferase